MLAAPTGDQLGEAELRVILHRRESPRDEELARSILGIGDRTTRVLERLETLFLAALRDESGLEYDAEAQIATLPTAPHQAAEWLFGFYRQTRLSPTNPPMGFSPPVSRFSYSINADEFGETLHVFACRELLRSYRPPGNETRNKPELAWTRSGGAHDAVRRFDDLLGAGSSAAGNGPGSPRGDINRYLLAPMLVRDPLAGHATILRGLLSSNHAKIATAVDGELGTQSPAAQSVGIWIRASTSNPTTNTTAERLNQIVGAIPHHGDGIMLLGDPVAPGAPDLSKSIADMRNHRKVIDLRGLSTKASLVAAQGAPAPVLYKSQASALVHLYRCHGLYCIVGNKSGGMDLAAFASIPSIQISPDAVPSASQRLYQRLVFTSLCSPFWRILDGSTGNVPTDALTNAITAALDTKHRAAARS